MSSVSAGLPTSSSGHVPKTAWAVWVVMFVPGHLAGWGVEWAWLSTHLVLATMGLTAHRGRLHSAAGVAPAGWFLLAATCTLLACLSMSIAHVWFHAPIIVGDLWDLLRFLIYVPLALSIGLTIGPDSLRSVDAALKAVVLFNLATAAVLLLRIPGLEDVVLLLYGDAKVQYEEGFIRIGIPFANPNFAALVFILFLAYFLYFRPSLTFAALTVIALLLTGSRSGWIAAVPVLLLAYARLIRRAATLRSPGAGVLLLGLHLAPLLYVKELVQFAESLNRLRELADALQASGIRDVKTADVRFEVFEVFYDFISRSPWLGWGPGRGLGLAIADSQYLAWAALFGIPAAVLVSLFFAWLFVGPLFRVRREGYGMPLVAVCASFMLMLAAGDFMKNFRLFFVAVLMAHCYRIIVTEPEAVEGPGRASA